MFKRIAVLTVTISLALPCFAQESKDREACEGINKIKCTAGLAITASGASMVGSGVHNDIRIQRTSGANGTVAIPDIDDPRLNRIINNALPEDRIEVTYKMSPEAARLTRMNALETALKNLDRDIILAEHSLKVAKNAMSKGSQTAVVHHENSLKNLESLKQARSNANAELFQLQKKMPVAERHLTTTRAFLGKDRQELRAVINANKLEGRILEVKIIRPSAVESRLLRAYRGNAKAGALVLAAGGAIIAHEIFTTRSEEELSATDAQIFSREEEPKSLKQRIEERNAQIEAATGVK